DATDNPFASPRSRPFPMPPGVPMYFALRLAEGARATNFLGGPLHPHTYPAAIASRFTDDGRPPCVDCGLCSGFGCPNNSKGAPPVTTLRRALLSGKCQLIYEAQVIRLLSSGRTVTGAQYIGRRHATDRDGQRLHPRGQPDRVGAPLPALREPRQLERPGRPQPDV